MPALLATVSCAGVAIGEPPPAARRAVAFECRGRADRVTPAIGTSSGAKEPGFVFFQGGRLFVRFAAGADAALPSARGGDFRAS